MIRKLLSGAELAGYIKERQARQGAGPATGTWRRARLAIVQTIDDPVIDGQAYVRLATVRR